MSRGRLGRSVSLLVALACALPMAGLSAELPSADPNPNVRLMRAIWRQDHDAVAAALKAGASANYIAPFSEFKEDFSGVGWSSHPDRLISALGLAAQLGDLVAMDDVIEAGADLNMHARADQTNLPPVARHADLPSGPATGLDMAKRLVLKGYRPTAQDITSALELQKTKGWEDWAAVVLDAPGVPQRITAIENGTDPDYQKLAAEQAADRDQAHQAETEAYGRQLQVAEQAHQAALYNRQAVAGAGVGDMVCSKPGVYRTKIVGYVQGLSGNRVGVRVLGAYNRDATNFRAGEIHWDDIDNWTPCSLR